MVSRSPDELLVILRKISPAPRVRHAVAVGEWAAKLGRRYGWEAGQARAAGFMHDCVRDWEAKKLMVYHPRVVAGIRRLPPGPGILLPDVPYLLAEFRQ